MLSLISFLSNNLIMNKVLKYMFDFEQTQNSLYATIYDEYNVFTQVVQNEGVYFSKT